MKLTPKQEKFAQLVAEGNSQADAYRQAFTVGANTKPQTVWRKAHEVMGKVSARVDALRKPAAEAVQITLGSHLEQLERLREAALSSGNVSAAVAAEVARGKASGVAVEKSEQITKGDVSLTLNLGGLSLNPEKLGW